MKSFHSEFLSMGTIINQDICGENGEEVLNKAEIIVKNLEDKMSFFKSTSEVYKLNKNGSCRVSLDTFKVIKMAKEISKLTGGFFDVSVAAIVDLWKIFSKDERVPTAKEIENALDLVDYNGIDFIEDEMVVQLRKNQCVDLGAIAKGYAADRIIDIYKEGKIEYGYVDLGGNVYVYNSPKGKDFWTVGIQNPLGKRGDYLGAIYAKNESIVTSGIYERYFVNNGNIYGHIINPLTGYPKESDFLSVTVVGKCSAYCDGLSTAIFLMDFDEG
ncbi:MAG: FAD:protein FMN transferase, partial [Clostridium sp.]